MEVAPVVVTGLALQGLLADVAFPRSEEVVVDDVAAIEHSELGRFARMVVEVLVDGMVARDLRIVAALCAEQRPGTVRDFVATEAEQYARQTAKQIAFATATQVPALVDIVSDKFAAQVGAVDLAGSSAAESEDVPTAVVVAALY